MEIIIPRPPEGIINSKLKNKKNVVSLSNPSKRMRSGYTLIEMTVVMSIISIMFLLGAYALVSVRDQYIADQVVEELITQTRDAQNKSVSIQKDASGNSIKVWGVQISGTFSSLISIAAIGSTNTTTSPYYYPSGLTVNNGRYIYFASPFGKAYVSQGQCSWKDSGKATKELVSTSCTLLTNASTLTITYKGQSRTLTVKPNGDIYAN